MKTLSMFLLAGLLLMPTEAYAQDPRPESLSSAIVQRIEKSAGEKSQQWLEAYAKAPEKLKTAVAFQLQHMPTADLETLEPEFIVENARLAYQALESANWKDQISEQLFLNDILPYANIDETREDWRSDFLEKCAPIVIDCQTPGDAAQKLNRELFNLVKVHYSTERRKANQSPSESIEQGKASCTGLSILLVDACRSVGIPARLAGIPSWVDKRGNHTWVEVWDNGQWHFTGADEPSDQGLNHAWFQADAKKALKNEKMNSIYAVSFQKTETRFPMVWSRDGSKTVYAVNVTDRYTQSEQVAIEATKLRIRVWAANRKDRVAANVELTCKECVGAEPMTGTSKAGRADLNDILEFDVVPGRTYELKVTYQDQQYDSNVKIQEQATQLHEVHLPEN